jgi:hypothetical protein
MQRATPSCVAAETTRLACTWSIYPRLPPVTSQTQADQVRFGVATMGSPPTATLLKASTKLFLTGIPGTTPSLLRKHPPDSIATAKGHLHLIRQDLRSTKRSTPAEQDVELDSAFPTAHPGRPASPTQHHILSRCVPVSRRAFMDLAGRFPFKSIGGFEYMLIMFSEDGNYIHVELMRTRGAKEYAQAYEQGLTFFRERGIFLPYLDVVGQRNQ